MRYLLALALFFLGVSSISSQEGQRYTEEEIAAQAQFIKATQKKLIGKVDQAIEIYEEILKKVKNHPVALFDLSRIYLEIGEKDKSIDHAEKAVKWDPKNLWYKESLAEIYFYFEDYASSGRTYRELIQSGQHDRVLFFHAQEAFEKAINEDEALEILSLLEKQYGVDEYSVQETTRILLNQGKNQAALAKANELITFYPKNLEYYQLNARLQEDFGSQKKARELYRKILQMDPSNSAALVYMASKDQKGNQLSDLRAIVLNKGVNLDTKIKALIPYAKKISANHPDKNVLLDLSSELVAMHPEEAKVYALNGDMMYNSGDLTNAEIEYLKSLEYNKSVFDIWLQVMIIQNELKKYEELKNFSYKAFDYYPNQAAAYIFHGMAQAALGDMSEAETMLSEAQVIGTNDAFLKRNILILDAQITASKNGEELREMTKEDMLMMGIKDTDDNVVSQITENTYLVRVKISDKGRNP